jgi:hypothetical protein
VLANVVHHAASSGSFHGLSVDGLTSSGNREMIGRSRGEAINGHASNPVVLRLAALGGAHFWCSPPLRGSNSASPSAENGGAAARSDHG